MKLAAVLLVGSAVSLGASSFVLPASTVFHKRFPLHSASASAATTVESTDNAAIIEGMPSHSPATGLPNLIHTWRGYNVRYQVSGPPDADHTLLLVHGLFVNADHWRKTLTGLQDLAAAGNKNQTVRVFALDLLGSGWSDKPFREDKGVQLINGENGRFLECDSVCYREQQQSATKSKLRKQRSEPILTNVPLGTPAGGNRMASALQLRHPLRSPYNFYTWAEQICDFTNDVIHADVEADAKKKVTLVANSIGTMSSLQSILDEPYLFNGCFVINPNFRELHMAEVPLSPIAMPLVRQVQRLLRAKGHGVFKAAATKDIVTQILKEPYAVAEAVDDELVDVLLTPLLTKGADEVVFDTLSYSAGPLPEQQLSSPDFPYDCPVWVTYGRDDPWTPPKRVENLGKVCGRPGDRYGESAVERVVPLEGAGHCPHDEVPDRVNELIMEFLDRLS